MGIASNEACDRVLEWVAWLIRSGRVNVLVLVMGSQDSPQCSSAASSCGHDAAVLEAPAAVLAGSQVPLRMLPHPREEASLSGAAR